MPMTAKGSVVEEGRGAAAVRRMAQAGQRADLVQVQAALDVRRRVSSNLLCGRWVNNHLAPEDRPAFGRRNLRTLAKHGIVVPLDDRARAGHRRYYELIDDDVAGISLALREFGLRG